ncbi:response regulator transcription factor [Kocuria atrinae]|uniref:helix-turn-helix transcriptional regulator n=1 Tax=Kocuria atrinae TaxID=592377 RepID=UPI00264B1670|nr:response regulator transcription factor [Kocuria sp.]
MNDQQAPITLALVNDYPVVIEGLARMLANHERLTVNDLSSGEPPNREVDLVLYDAFAAKDRGKYDVIRLLEDTQNRKLVIYTWNVAEDQVQKALDLGIHGFLSKELTADQLTDALVRIHEGERLVLPEPVSEESNMADWPGRHAGLSPRESEVVALITQGATNDEIARTCYLSINSVKSYIRSAYRKMGVERRAQAVLWGVQNGMEPKVSRS